MGDLVNLKRYRKGRARQEAAAKAEANRLHFGRSGTDRRSTAAEAERMQRQLEGKRLQREAPEETKPAADHGRQDEEKPERGR
ncbi:DUF4169 family protein [Marinibaculum pumilum]|uniref:DUF4169 family protein n=1 Tax=Marinibaculum pumilum TaxID=1766165 RepID=A0ABV7L083_9PROT